MTQERVPLIAHVVHRLDVGGMENGLVNLINHLPAERFRHAIVSLTDVTEFAGRLKRDDVQVVTLGKRPGNDPRLYASLYRVFRKMRPAIVHTRNLSTIEAVVPAALAGVPFRVHGEHGRDVFDLEGRSVKYRWLRKLLSPWIHCFIALSRDLESYLTERVGVPREKVVRICNGVDVERFHPAGNGREALPPEAAIDASDFVVIGSVTRLQDVKDPVTLARAFVKLVERGYAPKVRLVIAGDGPLASAVEETLRQADAIRYAWLAGRRDDVPALLRAFDVFALSSRVEGISNTVLEAMASGLPVVASRVGGNAELVQDGLTGALVPPSAPEALADALQRYVDDPERRAAHGLAARALAEEEFALSGMVERYEGVYERLVSKRATMGWQPGSKEERKLPCAE